MNVTINILELASELAHNELKEKHSDSIELYQDTDEDDVYYTEEAQDIFNEMYDYYYSVIESCKL
jgi:hypothetical protein